MKLAASICVLLPVLFTMGCGHPSDVVGHWAIDQRSIPEAAKKSARFDAISQMTIDFKTDKTFKMEPVMDGTYTIDGHQVNDDGQNRRRARRG